MSGGPLWERSQSRTFPTKASSLVYSKESPSTCMNEPTLFIQYSLMLSHTHLLLAGRTCGWSYRTLVSWRKSIAWRLSSLNSANSRVQATPTLWKISIVHSPTSHSSQPTIAERRSTCLHAFTNHLFFLSHMKAVINYNECYARTLISTKK